MRFQTQLLIHVQIHIVIFSFHSPDATSSFCLSLNYGLVISFAGQKQPLALSLRGKSGGSLHEATSSLISG